MTESRTAEVLAQLQKVPFCSFFLKKNFSHFFLFFEKQKKKVEKIKEEEERKAYIDPQKSVEAKDRGNTHFKNGEFPEAIKEYTEAIKRNPDDHVLYSNRAAAYTKLGEYGLGMKDCEKCLKMKPDFGKITTKTLFFFS